jgi:ABC-type uncharacterized transport system permease subunit
MKFFRELLFPAVAVGAAFLAGSVVIAVIGDDPIETYRLLIGSAISWPDGIGYTLFYATPLIFTGLAVALGFRCGLLNIGAEGQLTIAAFATAWAGISLSHASIWVALPITCIVALFTGAVWGTIPGILKARFGSHEVINTIMMNFIAAGVASALTRTYFKEPGDPILQTSLIGQVARIPRLGQIVSFVPARIPVNLAFVLALVTSAVVYAFLWRTKWGYELRAAGVNPSAAEYGGISVRKQIVMALTISGGLAGMVAINEVLGYRYRYYQGFSPQYGFTGIAVALLGRNHPAGVVIAALFFGALTRGSLFVDIFTERVSKDLVLILQALVILFAAAEALFRRRFEKKSL